MKKIVSYTIISGNPLPNFLENMAHALVEGWQPIGGVAMTQINMPSQGGQQLMALAFCQAMVKYEE